MTPSLGTISAAALASTGTRSRRSTTRSRTAPRGDLTRVARSPPAAADRHPRRRHAVAPRPAQRRRTSQPQVLVVGEVARLASPFSTPPPRTAACSGGASSAPQTPPPGPRRAGACCAPPAPGRSRTGSACPRAAPPAPRGAAASPGRAPARAFRWQSCALTLAGKGVAGQDAWVTTARQPGSPKIAVAVKRLQLVVGARCRPRRVAPGFLMERVGARSAPWAMRSCRPSVDFALRALLHRDGVRRAILFAPVVRQPHAHQLATPAAQATGPRPSASPATPTPRGALLVARTGRDSVLPRQKQTICATARVSSDPLVAN